MSIIDSCAAEVRESPGLWALYKRWLDVVPGSVSARSPKNEKKRIVGFAALATGLIGTLAGTPGRAIYLSASSTMGNPTRQGGPSAVSVDTMCHFVNDTTSDAISDIATLVREHKKGEKLGAGVEQLLADRWNAAQATLHESERRKYGLLQKDPIRNQILVKAMTDMEGMLRDFQGDAAVDKAKELQELKEKTHAARERAAKIELVEQLNELDLMTNPERGSW